MYWREKRVEKNNFPCLVGEKIKRTRKRDGSLFFQSTKFSTSKMKKKVRGKYEEAKIVNSISLKG